MAMTKPLVYVADTENNVPKSDLYDGFEGVTNDAQPRQFDNSDLDDLEIASNTRVWAAALCEALESPDYSDVDVDNSVEDFLSRCRNLPSGSTVFFHNLAYDGPLIVTALIRMGYELDSETAKWKKPAHGAFSATITDTGVWYGLKVTFNHGNRCIEFKDSLKILPFSVDAIGSSLKTKHKKMKGAIDYQLHRPVGYEPTPIELDYIKCDVLVMSEAIHLMSTRDTDLTKQPTIGSGCMTDYKLTIGGGDRKRGNKLYNAWYPQLDPEVDLEIRKAYKGGFCYVNRDNPAICNNQILDLRNSQMKGETYDVNSLYPSAMYSKKFPLGEPWEIDPKDFDPQGRSPFVVKMIVDFWSKPKHVPFIQLKNNSQFAENEYVKDSNGPVELTLTQPDYELFMEQYDYGQLSVVRVWNFAEADDLFNEYIEKWYELKANATNPVDRMLAKLMLNNLYGKMAQSMIRNSGDPYIDEDNILRYEFKAGEARGGYIPVGAYITAYARQETVRAAQANFDAFLYADTDSIHLLGPAKDISVGDELGEWDHEATWDMARFVRQKTYAERITHEWKKGKSGAKEYTEVDKQIVIKAAGATPVVKERIAHELTDFDNGVWSHRKLTRDQEDVCVDVKRSDEEVFERFTYGVTEAGKLTRRSVTGGVVLKETTFKIHVPDGLFINKDTGVVDSEWTVL